VHGSVSTYPSTTHLSTLSLHDALPISYGTFIVRPRSYLIVGSLDQFVGSEGGLHHDKFRSFELHRRNLYEPEVLTFDEVLARAEWQVSKLSQEEWSCLVRRPLFVRTFRPEWRENC